MSITAGTRVALKAIDRGTRLQNEPSRFKRNFKFSISEANNVIRNLSNSKVVQEDCNLVFGLLEKAGTVSKSKERDFARSIATSIIPGIQETVDINLEDYSISDESKAIIENAISETSICNRILNNQYLLERRFNIDNTVKKCGYNLDKIISEMCEFVDTYNIPNDYKFNVALENTLYSLVKNGVDIPSDEYLVSSIAEYFMMRDMVITDDMYKKYQTVLEGCKSIFDIHKPSYLIEAVETNNSTYFLDRTIRLLEHSSDSYIKEFIIPMAKKIATEADAADYIDTVSAYIEEVKDLDDQARLYYSVANIPNYSPVSRDFVKIKSRDAFDGDKFDSILARDCISSDVEVITEEEPNNPFDLSSYKNMFNEDTRSDNIDKIIATYKASQDKSPNVIKRFITKLHTKSPESIVDETSDIMSFIRGGVLVAIAASCPIGPIISAVTGFFSWLLSSKINESEATKLLNHLRSEKKKIENKIDKASDKKKKELEEYLDCLALCEDRVETYLNSISSDADTSDDDDDLGDDFDFEDESAIINVASILNIAENSIISIAESSIANKLPNLINLAMKENMLSDMGYIIRESSIPNAEYIDELRGIMSESKDPAVRTAIMKVLDNKGNIAESNNLRSVLSMDIADKALDSIYEQVVTEKFNLNTVKLAMQNAKAKLKDLSTKEKSMWQSVDAAGSGLIKSIQKAMTSDRREAIIRGSIIPSFSKCIKGAIALAGTGLIFGPTNALIAAVGALGVSKALNMRERQLIFDEIDTELTVVEKEIEMAQNDGDMKKYRFLLNYQKKLKREYSRIRYGLKANGRNIPPASIPGRR